MTPPIRMCVHGNDFLIKRGPDGWTTFVRKVNTTDERTKLESRRSAKHAEAFALGWAYREFMFAKQGRPSQLKVAARKQVRIIEEE